MRRLVLTWLVLWLLALPSASPRSVPAIEATAAPSGRWLSAPVDPPGGDRAAASMGGTIAGLATWYCLVGRSACTRGYPAGGMYAAAGPALRVGNWRGRTVLVSAGGRHVAVKLIDACSCSGGRLLDLYAAAFARLAPLSRGVIHVTIGAVPAPPATSTLP